MSLTILKGDAEAPIDALQEATIAVLGFGNQGQAHAANLRDANLEVIIGARPGHAGAAAATEQGFPTASIAEATARADLAIIALPDEIQPDLLASTILPAARPGTTLGFIHGFAVTMSDVQLPMEFGIVMVAPKGPGTTLRARFLEGQGIPALVAVHQESQAGLDRARALAWANGIGCVRAGLIMTTFADECRTDLFGEQAVLCGGMTWLVLAAYEALVARGYPPELAYLECCHEVKQVADLMYERGISGMMEAISNTAEYGAHLVGPEIQQAIASPDLLRTVLDRIESGAFASTMLEEYRTGFEAFNAARQHLRDHPIEAAGRSVRALMPWLQNQPPSPS